MRFISEIYPADLRLRSLGSQVFPRFGNFFLFLTAQYPGSLGKFVFLSNLVFSLKYGGFQQNIYSGFLLNFQFCLKIYVWDCLRIFLFTILEFQGGTKYLFLSFFSRFSTFPSFVQQKSHYLIKKYEKTRFSKFCKNDVYKILNFGPGNKIKVVPGVNLSADTVFLRIFSTKALSKSLFRPEIDKNCFLRQPQT